MKPFLQKHHRVLFYATWTVLAIIQARYTELMDDEAYYWIYSKYFDWGYVDHPPMTGLLVKIGYALVPNELGVRLLPLVLHVCSLWLIEKLTVKKDPFLFYGIAFSLAVLQLMGYVSVPDIPLIFFTALFFRLYQKFTQTESWKHTLLLGFCAALLLYSKYHAVLIIFFTLLSNVKLFTRPRVYIAGLMALLLFLPHLWWQYQHNWVSFRYHLFESNVNAYKFRYTTDYLAGQLLLAGPLAGLLLLPAAFLYRPKTATEKALRFTLFGIYGFFLLSSFRGKVEGNWTAPALVPLIVCAHQYLQGKAAWRRILYGALPVTLLLVIFARVIMIADIIPAKAVKSRFHSWKEWPQVMREKTHRLPVVFSNSYQRASKYWFYSGQMTFSQNWYVNGRNNYNFWPVEDSMLGKPVYLLDIFDLGRLTDTLSTPIGTVGYRYDSSFASFVKVHFVPEHKAYRIRAGEPLSINGHMEMPLLYKNFIASHPGLPDTTAIGIFNKKGWMKEIRTSLRLQQVAADNRFSISLDPQLPQGSYYLRFTVKKGYYNATHNSEKIDLEVQ